MAKTKNLKFAFLIFTLVLVVAIAGCTQKEETPQQLPPELLQQLVQQSAQVQQPTGLPKQPLPQRDLSLVNCVREKDLGSFTVSSVLDYKYESSDSKNEPYVFSTYFSNGSSVPVNYEKGILTYYKGPEGTRRGFEVTWVVFSTDYDYNTKKASVEDDKANPDEGHVFQEVYDLRGATVYPYRVVFGSGSSDQQAYLFFDGTRKSALFDFTEAHKVFEEDKKVIAAYADQICPK